MPPLTDSTCPVIYDALSEARNTAACAISCAVPIRFKGIDDCTLSFTLSESTAVISVSIYPGAIALTVICLDASSFAADFVSPITPALDAA